MLTATGENVSPNAELKKVQCNNNKYVDIKCMTFIIHNILLYTFPKRLHLCTFPSTKLLSRCTNQMA